MKTVITTILVLTLVITSAFSQDLEGVWHGVTKTPANKEITFVFLFEKNEDTYKSTMATPTFNASGIKP